jgi:hypothetical protein
MAEARYENAALRAGFGFGEIYILVISIPVYEKHTREVSGREVPPTAHSSVTG